MRPHGLGDIGVGVIDEHGFFPTHSNHPIKIDLQIPHHGMQFIRIKFGRNPHINEARPRHLHPIKELIFGKLTSDLLRHLTGVTAYFARQEHGDIAGKVTMRDGFGFLNVNVLG